MIINRAAFEYYDKLALMGSHPGAVPVCLPLLRGRRRGRLLRIGLCVGAALSRWVGRRLSVLPVVAGGRSGGTVLVIVSPSTWTAAMGWRAEQIGYCQLIAAILEKRLERLRGVRDLRRIDDPVMVRVECLNHWWQWAMSAESTGGRSGRRTVRVVSARCSGCACCVRGALPIRGRGTILITRVCQLKVGALSAAIALSLPLQTRVMAVVWRAEQVRNAQ